MSCLARALSMDGYQATVKKKEHRIAFIITCKKLARATNLSSTNKENFSIGN
tara:strand:+ start:3023 stop:3178 length:156 start_codon:yes stop_codon:yes gene_type:complete